MEELNGRIWWKMEELNGRKAERLHPKMVKIRGSCWLRQNIFRKPHTFNSATLKPGCLWLSSSTHSDSISLPARPRNSWGIITKQKQNQSPAPTPQVPARHRPAQGGLATWAQMWHFNLLFCCCCPKPILIALIHPPRQKPPQQLRTSQKMFSDHPSSPHTPREGNFRVALPVPLSPWSQFKQESLPGAGSGFSQQNGDSADWARPREKLWNWRWEKFTEPSEHKEASL